MNVNKVVELTGTIVDCNLIDDKKFFVELNADTPYDLEDVERRAEFIKELQPENPWDEDEVYSDNYYIHKDRVTKGCSILFESINVPTLKGSFRDIRSNDEALYKRARVLGAFQRMKGGNIVIQFHLIDDGAPLVSASDEEDYASWVGTSDDIDF